jgi:hypothetical protein
MKRYFTLAAVFSTLFLLILNSKAYADIADTLRLKNDDFNVLMAYKGSTEGTAKHNPVRSVAFTEKENDVVYGFTAVEDKITWIVNAPEAADYIVAIQFTGKKFQSDQTQSSNPNKIIGLDPNCTIEIEANGKVLKTELKRLTLYNESPKIAGTRQWFDGLLKLKKGVNKITFHFSKLSEAQIKFAKEELDAGIMSKSSNSIGIKDIALVRPEVWHSMKLRAQKLKPDLSWMVNGKYGLFTHWSLLTYPLYGDKKAYENFEWGVNNFDVEAYADMVKETGASWVIFTTCHGMQMFPAPIKTLNDVLPGRTTNRDLIADLAAALSKRKIKLLLYYNFSPTGDVATKLGINSNPEKWMQYIIDFVREVSLRYGKSIAGWGYFDSTVSAYEVNMPWETFYRAAKAGNPDAVVGISSHWWAEYSPFNDLQTGDSGGYLNDPLDKRLFGKGERYEGLQEHSSFVLDGSWIPREPYNGIIRANTKIEGGPTFTDQEYITYFKKMADAHVPVTVNLLITQDVTSKQPFVNPKSLELMRKIKKALDK